MESSNPDVGNIIRFRENGKIKYLETPDAGIKRAVDSLQSKSEGAWILKALRATMSFLRARYTVQNPDFAVANIVRDVTDAFIHNRQLNANPILAIIETWNAGFRGVLSKDKDFIDWQANGGAQASFVSEDVDYIQRSINDATSTRRQRYRKNFWSQALDDLQKLSELSENIVRLNNYKAAKNKLAAQRADGKTTITDKQLAALESRKASVDFSQSGRSMRELNRVFLFSNAAIRGLDLWRETLTPL